MSSKTLGLLIVAATLTIASVVPASAEFFGCNEPRIKISYSSPAYRQYAQAPFSSSFAPRQRFASQPSQRRYASQSRAFQWH